jgi:hypothetical protein
VVDFILLGLPMGVLGVVLLLGVVKDLERFRVGFSGGLVCLAWPGCILLIFSMRSVSD